MKVFHSFSHRIKPDVGFFGGLLIKIACLGMLNAIKCTLSQNCLGKIPFLIGWVVWNLYWCQSCLVRFFFTLGNIARGSRALSLPSSYIWWYLVPCRKSALAGFLKKDCISTLVILYANWEQCGGKRKNGGSSVAERRTKVHPLWKNVWINTKNVLDSFNEKKYG